MIRRGTDDTRTSEGAEESGRSHPPAVVNRSRPVSCRGEGPLRQSAGDGRCARHQQDDMAELVLKVTRGVPTGRVIAWHPDCSANAGNGDALRITALYSPPDSAGSPDMSNSMARMPTLFGDEVQPPVAALKARDIQDPAGMWHAARARHGIDDRMWFGLYQAEARAPRWHTCSHRHSDGLGALSLLLRECGFVAGHPPEGRPHAIPHWSELWRSWRTRPALRPLAMRWQAHDPSLASCQAHEPVSVLLSSEHTQLIEDAAACAGVSTTLWLQWTADRALRASLADADSVSGWLFPVNLRGSVQAPDRHANQCSALTLRLGPESTARSVRQLVNEGFGRHEHWHTWLMLNLGRWVGQRGVNMLYRWSQAPSGSFAGCYTNLGEWNVPGLAGVACTAPSNPAYPVSVGTVLCNGRRTLACRLHPVIGGNAQRAIEYLKHWREATLRVSGDDLYGLPPEPAIEA